MENTDIIKVAFYIRVSTTEQGTKWYWLDYQLQALNDLVNYRSNQNPKWITNKKWIYEDSWYMKIVDIVFEIWIDLLIKKW